MKLLLISDCHVRGICPEGRRDTDFLKTQKRKWESVIDIAESNDCKAILQAGDLFDNPNPSLSVMNMFAEILMELQELNIDFLTIPGQHDLYMRNQNLSNTAMGFFRELLLLETNEFITYNSIDIWMNAFGRDYSHIKIDNSKFNILVTHDMIGNSELYPGQRLTKAEDFLNTFKQFDVILCGDYHYPFKYKSKDGRLILNTGCLLRLTRNERDMNRKPFVYVLDTEIMKLRKCYIDAEDAGDIFIPKSDRSVKDERSLDDFIEKLKGKEKVGLSYLSVLDNYYEENDTSEAVQELITEVLSNE